jgi:lipoprotein-anchoring transpeptidase ErfK/SrfK
MNDHPKYVESMNHRFFLAVFLLGFLYLCVPGNLLAGSDSDKPDRPETESPEDKSRTHLEILMERLKQERKGLEVPEISLYRDTVGVASVADRLALSFAIKDMRLEVNIGKKELYVFSGREKVTTYPVAVGKPDWPTRPGNWSIYEVVWNPWWHPPDEEWAWYRAIMAPGDPDNPLGRAQLIYDAPRSIHGTIEPSSIGRAVSHGSIRVTNEVAMKLARHVMESAGVVYDEEWYREVQGDRSRNVRIHLSQRVPIRVYN